MMPVQCDLWLLSWEACCAGVQFLTEEMRAERKRNVCDSIDVEL